MDEAPLARLWGIVEEHRAELETALMKRVSEVPPLARLLASLDPTTLQARSAVQRRLQRAAWVDGDWQPYLDHMRTDGARYAALGVPIGAFYQLTHAYRPVMVRLVLDATTDMDEVLALLSASEAANDDVMLAMSEGYLAGWEERWQAATHERDALAITLEHAPHGVVVCHRQAGRWVMGTRNPAAKRIHALIGYDPASGLSEAGVQHADQALATGQVGRATTTAVGADGDRYTFSVWYVPLSPDAVGVLFEDVTEQDRHRQTRDRYIAALERTNRELDDFAYIASHDLRAPLRDVDNLAQWIAEDTAQVLPDETRGHLTRLQGRVRRMEDLLVDLLAYARAGRQPEASEVFPLKSALERAIDQAAVPRAFEVTVTGDLPELQTPRTPLEIVIRNLVSNAAKHHDGDHGRIDVHATRDGAVVRIAVTDDGPGIPAQYHARVFQVFQTLRPRDEVEGTGVGLALARKLTMAHGGNIELHSEGRGATFVVSWPIAWRREDHDAP